MACHSILIKKKKNCEAAKLHKRPSGKYGPCHYRVVTEFPVNRDKKKTSIVRFAFFFRENANVEIPADTIWIEGDRNAYVRLGNGEMTKSFP